MKPKHPDYMDQLNTYYGFILRPFCGDNVFSDWQFDTEPMVGSFYFEKDFGDKAIVLYATPYWEQIDGISVYIVIWKNSNPIDLEPATIPLQDITGNSALDTSNYFDKIKPILDHLDENYSQDSLKKFDLQSANFLI